MHGHADRARLVGHGSGDRLTDPPRGVRGELEALLPIEFLDGSDQAEVAFLDQVKEKHAASGVTLGERDDEAQVRLEQVVLGLLAVGGRPLEFALALEVEGVTFGLEQVLGIQAGLDAFRKVDFLFGVEQRDAADLLEVVLDRVGGGARCDHTPLGVLAGGRERLVVIVITDHERALGFGLLGLGLVVLILVVLFFVVFILVIFVVLIRLLFHNRNRLFPGLWRLRFWFRLWISHKVFKIIRLLRLLFQQNSCCCSGIFEHVFHPAVRACMNHFFGCA